MFYRLAHSRNFWITLTGDAVLIICSYFLAYLIRFDGRIPEAHLAVFGRTVLWMLPLKLAAFYLFALYKGMWRYFGLHDVLNLAKACAAAFAAAVVIILALYRFQGYSRSVLLIDLALSILFIGGFRVAIRLFLCGRLSGGFLRPRDPQAKNALIIGAGSAGEKLLREIFDNGDLHLNVVGLVDDDPAKFGITLHGVPVLGAVPDLARLVWEHEVHQVIIAVPSAGAAQMRRLVGFCENSGAPFKTLPGLGDLIEGKVSVSHLREVRYEDLLGREPVQLECEAVGGYLTGKPVLVTGGAGSIGSELCRQVARFSPSLLIIVEINESGLYEFELQLRFEFPGLKTATVLAPVQNRERMRLVFERYRPQVVFHAAAYKHVPMLEANPCEAVFNNVVGAQVVMEMSLAHRLDRCVIVSTDKAVRPTSVMGASKRVTELLAQCYARENGVKYMAVRFGNVVGSAGSVIPLFRRQIDRGGPVTVTHPEVTRYFMTIPEASRLILQAGAVGSGGELFVLKMGTPVRIAGMARDMITLCGFKPDEDIMIEYTGLRPGEKLYEELITEGEGIQKTRHKDIMVLRPDECPSLEAMEGHIQELARLAVAQDDRGVKLKLSEIVPEYRPQLEENQQPQTTLTTAEKQMLADAARAGRGAEAGGTMRAAGGAVLKIAAQGGRA